MKLFLSHEMSKLSEEEVLELRRKAMEQLRDIFGEDVEFIENYVHSEAPEDAGQLWHLGRSIQQMQEADLIVIIENYKNSRGCKIEKEIIDLYNLNSIELEINE